MSKLRFIESSILIDDDHANRTLNAYNEPEYRQFKKNQKKVNPIYLERDIEYKFNSLGYRTKEIKDLDREFVLVFGCSHTEGIGNFEEDIWCSQLLNSKGIDFLNLGKASSGPDIQYINSLQWIKNCLPIPKLVIYQWPQIFRKSFAYEEENQIIMRLHNANCYPSKDEEIDNKWFLKRYCRFPGQMKVDNYIHYYNANMLWNSLNIPVLNWSWSGDFEHDFEDLHLIETEDTGRARDLMHDGPDIHRQVADQLSPLVDKLL